MGTNCDPLLIDLSSYERELLGSLVRSGFRKLATLLVLIFVRINF